MEIERQVGEPEGGSDTSVTAAIDSVGKTAEQVIIDPTKVVGYTFDWDNPSLGECKTEVLKVQGNVLTIKITTPEGEKITQISSAAYKIMHDKKIA